jgi:hypothetical protein
LRTGRARAFPAHHRPYWRGGTERRQHRVAAAGYAPCDCALGPTCAGESVSTPEPSRRRKRRVKRAAQRLSAGPGAGCPLGALNRRVFASPTLYEESISQRSPRTANSPGFGGRSLAGALETEVACGVGLFSQQFPLSSCPGVGGRGSPYQTSLAACCARVGFTPSVIPSSIAPPYPSKRGLLQPRGPYTLPGPIMVQGT